VTTPRLPAALRAKVLAAARAAPSPARPAVQRAAIATVALGFAALALVFAFVGGADLTTRPPAFLATTLIGWGVLAIAATWGGATRGRSMLGRSAPVLGLVALATGPAFLAWMIVGTMLWPGALGFTPTPRLHVACFAATLAMALGPLVALAIVRRGGDPRHPRASGAALGAVAGAWAGLMIDLHCPVSDALHVTLGHVVPIVALAAVGAILGKRVLGLAT
jgi:hypothetical protein